MQPKLPSVMLLLKQTLSALIIIILSSCGTEEIAEPIAGLSHTSDNGYLAPTSVSFKNESSGAKEYTWDFGDGSPVSSNINPVHVYEEAGTFTVTLIASNGNQVDQVTEEVVVFILPTADFIFSSDNDFKEQSEISFENKSLNSESYSWKFGDGGTSTEANPTHVYDLAGTYTVELTAKNAKGSDITTTEITINPLATEEQLQLNKLVGSWTLQSANDGTDRTGDFTDLVLTLGGNYVEGGTYNYSFTGTRPDPSPWPASGTWRFGTNKLADMIRDSGTSSEIAMTYAVTDTTLEINFTVPDGSNGWEGGTSRIKSVTGDWKFVFTK